MIRAAELQDFCEVERMIEDFWPSTGSGFAYKKGSSLPFIQLCHSQDLLVVAEKNGKLIGFGAAAKSPLIGNDSVYVGAELGWWIDPEHRGGVAGVKLLRFLEEAAKKAGCKIFNMAFMETSMPEAVRKIYLNEGYSLSETTYTERS